MILDYGGNMSPVPDFNKYRDFTDEILYWIREYQPTLAHGMTQARLRSILSFISGKDAYKAAKILEKGGWKVNEELVKILVGYVNQSKG